MRKFPTYRLVLALLVLLCAASLNLSAHAQKRPARGGETGQLLYDFRTDSPAPPSVKLSPAETRRVLDATFPRRLKSRDDCAPGATPSSEEDLAELRAAGQMAPEVYESYKGSFTAPGLDETLHLIAVYECGDMPRVLNEGTQQLVIRRGEQTVVSLHGFYGNVIAVRDLDGDGRQELLMKNGGFGQGVLEEFAKLVSFAGGRESTVHDFDEVFIDSCGMRESPDAIKAGVLRYVPAAGGRPARFLTDFYASRCYEEKGRPRLKDFRFLKRGKLYD